MHAYVYIHSLTDQHGRSDFFELNRAFGLYLHRHGMRFPVKAAACPLGRLKAFTLDQPSAAVLLVYKRGEREAKCVALVRGGETEYRSRVAALHALYNIPSDSPPMMTLDMKNVV